jgi:hypothetical protein
MVTTPTGARQLREEKYTAVRPDVMVRFSPSGEWELLDCFPFPIPDDIFKGKTDLACRIHSQGSSAPPTCYLKTDEESCVEVAQCGWCASTRKCVVGFESGVCSKSDANCPSEDWRFEGSGQDKKVTHVTGDSDCGQRASCKVCVTNSACGWHVPSGKCVAGTASGPNNNTHAIQDAREDWNFYYCSGSDACANFADCAVCSQASYCGWCEASQECYTQGRNRPIFDTCVDMYGFYVQKCPVPKKQVE